MQDLEQQLFSSGLPVAALMEKVGLAMAARLLKHPLWFKHGVLVLVGPGHNGGDGLVVARELHLAGVPVRVWCPIEARRELTAQHLRHLEWLGIERSLAPPEPSEPVLWIDALFGLGQTRPLSAELADLFRRRQSDCPDRLVSLDVPSGLCCDSGEPIGGQAACATLTLCVGLIKRGLCLDVARSWVGQLERIDLGLPQWLLRKLGDAVPRRLPLKDVASLVCPQPAATAMKYQRGRCLVVAGSDRYPGAAHLALRGVLASGCGSVQAHVPDGMRQGLWQVLPEVMAVDQHVDLDRLDAVLFGPGLGADPEIWSRWVDRLRCFPGLLLLDADGLNLLASSSEGWSWLRHRAGPTWLTPHAAEFSRLFPDLSATDQMRAAIEASRCSGCFILLKGAHSVAADPAGMAVLLVDTCPDAARTGFGDLLAGFATGWAARSLAAKAPVALETFVAAAALHARSAALARAGDASTVADCLKTLTHTCQKRRTNKTEV